MLLSLLLSCTSSTPAPPPSPPSLILFTLDTTRADAMGFAGNFAQSPTPNLDQIAAEGVWLEHAYAHVPTTLSSHASMFTGLDPHGHAIPRNGFPLSEELPTLAARLLESGYDTMAVIASSALDESTGILRGFRLTDTELALDMGRRHEDPAWSVEKRALALLEERDPDRPLFLWVHLFDAHSPYAPPEDIVRSWVREGYEPKHSLGKGIARAHLEGRLSQGDRDHLRGLYQAEVQVMDRHLGRILEAAEAALPGEPWVLVAGDHGEAFFESGGFPVGHGVDINPWAVHVPWILRGPGLDGGRSVAEPAALSSLGPTALDLLGLPAELGSAPSLRPLLEGQPWESPPLYLEATQPGSSSPPDWNNLQMERGLIWKQGLLIHAPLQGEAPGLYSLEGEPRDDPEALREGLSLLEAWDRSAPGFRSDAPGRLQREKLRALGYIEAPISTQESRDADPEIPP